MDKQLERNIIRALKERRHEAMVEVDMINQVLKDMRPPKPLASRTAFEINRDKILEVMSQDGQTSLEVSRKTGVPRNTAARVLNALVDNGRLDYDKVHGIHHYRLPREEMRIKAGDGVVKHKRR